MSKLDAIGAKSLEEILASIRKTLSGGGSDAASGQRAAAPMPAQATPELNTPADTEGNDDGLLSANTPRELTADEAGRARRVLAFDTIPAELRGRAAVTYWSGIPLGINDYEVTRDEIVRRIDALIPTLADQPAK